MINSISILFEFFECSSIEGIKQTCNQSKITWIIVYKMSYHKQASSQNCSQECGLKIEWFQVPNNFLGLQDIWEILCIVSFRNQVLPIVSVTIQTRINNNKMSLVIKRHKQYNSTLFNFCGCDKNVIEQTTTK